MLTSLESSSHTQQLTVEVAANMDVTPKTVTKVKQYVASCEIHQGGPEGEDRTAGSHTEQKVYKAQLSTHAVALSTSDRGGFQLAGAAHAPWVCCQHPLAWLSGSSAPGDPLPRLLHCSSYHVAVPPHIPSDNKLGSASAATHVLSQDQQLLSLGVIYTRLGLNAGIAGFISPVRLAEAHVLEIYTGLLPGYPVLLVLQQWHIQCILSSMLALHRHSVVPVATCTFKRTRTLQGVAEIPT